MYVLISLVAGPLVQSLFAAMDAQNLGKMIRPHLGKMIMSEFDSRARMDSLMAIV
jgi:hypothetical protein